MEILNAMPHNSIADRVRLHEQWRTNKCLNLIPSENVTSPAVRRLLSSDFGHRYTAPDHFYRGTHLLDEVEEIGEKTAMNIFHAEWATLKPLSGHTAVMAVTGNLTQHGDGIATVSPADGGYPGISETGIAPRLGLKNIYFAFDKHQMNINTEKSTHLLLSMRPRLVVFGASFILFPHPVRELSKVAHEIGARAVYDGSHVLGLMAGGKFQQPLQEGASVLYGSTHKSFFGPQGGLIVSKEEEGTMFRRTVHPAYVDNAHWNRIAALALALEEMKAFGKEYATQVVRNSKTLAKALDELHIEIMCSHLHYTESHQVILKSSELGQGDETANMLEHANIIVDKGVRLGTCEVTRRGMKEPEMEKIAGLVADILQKRRSMQSVKNEVGRLAEEFSRVEFCFQED